MKYIKSLTAALVTAGMLCGIIPCGYAEEDVLSESEINEIIAEAALRPFSESEDEGDTSLPLDDAESEKPSISEEENISGGEENLASDEDLSTDEDLSADKEKLSVDEEDSGIALFSGEKAKPKFDVWKMIYEPDYSDGVIDSHTDCISGYESAEIYEQNDMLNITMRNFSGSGVRLSPVAAGIPINRDCVIEYTISRTLFEAQILDRIGTPENAVGLTDIQVHAGGSALVAYRDSTEPDANQARKGVGGVGDNKNIRVVINARFSTGKMDVYLNDRLVVADKYMRDNMTGFSTMSLYYDCDYARTKCAVKDVYIYLTDDGGMTDEERVQADADALNFKGLWREGGTEINGMYSGNLCLYDVGGNGSDVTWSCSDESVVSPDGTVTGATPETVTLTATFTSGDAQVSKDIEFVPLPARIDINETPKSEELIYSNDFEDDADLPYEISTSDYVTGGVYIQGGRCVVERGELGYSGPTVYMWTKDRKPVKGLIGVEFDWDKGSSVGAWLRCGPIFFYWRPDNFLLIQTCSDPTSTNVLTTNAGNFKEKIHVQFVYDTNSSTVSCWIDGVNKLTGSYSRTPAQGSFSNFYAWVSEGSGSFYIDNLSMYYAIPTALDRLAYEVDALGYDDLLTKPFVDGNVLDSDTVNLPTTARYGSSIEWETDNPEAIDLGGNVHKDGWSENPEVTLTATINCSGLTRKKSFTFVVLRNIEGESAKSADMHDLNVNMLVSSEDEDKDHVTLALRLMPRGLRGSKIMWSSDNPHVVSSSGRVVRPKMGDGDALVTLTADFGGGLKKELHVTVSEDYYEDKQYHADEDFFGVWKDGAWEKEPRINYSYNNDKNLSLAEIAAKSGDYYSCKAHVLDYWRTRKKTYSSTARFNLATKIAQGYIYHENETSTIDVGAGVVACHDYERVEIDLSNRSIFEDSAALGISIMSLFSENSTVSILSREYEGGKFAPKLQLTVNGATKTYDVSEDTTIRAGKYEGEVYGKDEVLKVRLFGDFLGDESQRTLMRFNYDYITGSTDTINSAKLILYAKIDEEYARSKELAVCIDKSSFSEESSWNSITGFLYQWDGTKGKNSWETPKYASSEYLSQSCRFIYRGAVMAEYSYTKNEDYAYFLISEAMDFLADQGMERTFSGNTGAGTSRSLYGNYLACAVRQGFWPLIASDIIDSRYMSPEIFGCFLKATWDFEDVIFRTDLGTNMVNWGVIFYRALMQASAAMPELLISDTVFDKSREKLESFMKETTFDDGSYKEAATMYSISTLGTYRLIKQTLREYGFDTSKEYDEKLKKSGLYCLLLNGPRYTRWGDSGLSDAGGMSTGLYEPYVQFFGDYEMQYIGTYGAKGIKPAWTSKLYKDNMTAFLHSDWSKNQTFMFINSRGPSNHAHQDDNNIFLSSMDRTLLTDQGVGTYDVGNYQREWLTSTIAHNTVEINGKSQTGSGKSGDFGLQGKLYNWTTSSAFDFLSQNTISYREHEHRRSVTFIKPNLIIVSDRLTPNDLSSENTYKQAWHTPIGGGLTTDSEANTVKTNFATGANLYIASVQNETTLVEETGYFDYGSGQVGEVPFTYFEKENVKGAQEIDTVLMPYNGTDASVTVERISSGAFAPDRAAVKINVQKGSTTEVTYYILNYEGGTSEFGDYETDAVMAAVTVDKNGKIRSAVMDEGSYIKNKNESYILKSSEKTDNLSYSIVGDTGSVTFGDGIEFYAPDITIFADDKLSTVKINDKNYYFTQNGNEITFKNETYDDGFKRDDNRGGIVDKNSGAGGGSSGGNSGGNSGGSSGTIDNPLPSNNEKPRFSDIQNHWAEEIINKMAEKNIINGYPDNSFRPDFNITRAEFVSMIYKAVYGEPKGEYQNRFEDVSKGDWYAKYIEGATIKNMISPDTYFRPADPVTREEICKISAAAAKLESGGGELSFADKDLISSWAVPFVCSAYENNIITGYEDNTFRPKNNATRAEAAAILNRILK